LYGKKEQPGGILQLQIQQEYKHVVFTSEELKEQMQSPKSRPINQQVLLAEKLASSFPVQQHSYHLTKPDAIEVSVWMAA
jgi:hypothetical protein